MKSSSAKGDLLTALALSIGGVLTRVPYLALIPLFDDEVLQTMYALRIQPGEFLPLVGQDPYTGPLFVYIIAICLRVFGSSPVVPRIVIMIMGALTVGLTYLLARVLGLSRPSAALAGALMIANPHNILVSSHYAGATFMLPLFSTAFLTALVLAIRRESGLWLVAAGVLLGLAMQANPVLVLMLPGVAVWSFIQRKSAIGLRTRWPYLTAAASILAYAPVIVYNVQTGLAGIREVIAVRPYAWQLHLSPLAFIQNLQCLGLQLCRQVGGVLEGSENLATLMGLPILSGAWAIAGLLYATRRRLSLLPLAVASHMLIMPWLSGNYGMIWETRYTNHLTPLVFVAMSALAARVWSRVSASVRGPRIARAAKWPVGVLLVALGLWPLTSIFQYYERETAAGRTNTHYFAFWDEFTERWQGERVFLSESVNGFILAGDLNAPEYFGFNATRYFLATNNMPYDFMPIDQIMRTLAAGRVILILTNGELPRVELQTELVAWNSPDVMEACYRLGYGAYVIEEAQQVHGLPFVYMDETDVEPVAHPVEVDFSDQLAILGYELASGRVTPGEQLIVSVYWRAIDAMPETYTGFLHLTGPDGQLVTQDDHELGRGVFCTQLWQPGEVVREEYVLAVPGDAAAGRYTLRVGVYSFPSLERLAVSSADVSVQDDLATLGTVDLALRVGPGE